MFDKHTYHAGDSHITRVEVKQAGLHDATKNYKEFRDDAEREAAKLEIKRFGADNVIRYLKSEVQRNIMTNDTNVHVVYEINGKVFQMKSVVQDRLGNQQEERMRIAQHIASEITNQLLTWVPVAR
jgi:hypothetical protein